MVDIKNNAGGVSFKCCKIMQIKRFLITGNLCGSYYATASEIKVDTFACLDMLVQNDYGPILVDTLKEFSKEGRAPKSNTIVLCLVHCALYYYKEVKKGKKEEDLVKFLKLSQLAYDALPYVCRIPEQLFLFVDECQKEINRLKSRNVPPVNITPQRKIVTQEKSSEYASDLKMELVEEGPKTDNVTSREKIKKKKRFRQKVLTQRKVGGWGRMRCTGISKWYKSKTDAKRLLYHLTKYRKRHGWSHKRLLQLAHPKFDETDPEKQLVIAYISYGYRKAKKEITQKRKDHGFLESDLWKDIQRIELVKLLANGKSELRDELKKELNITISEPCDIVLGIIKDKTESKLQLVREHVPGMFLNLAQVWESLLEDMPMWAMIRNLGNMAQKQLFDNEKNVEMVVDALQDVDRLMKSKVHPLKLLIALKQFGEGCGYSSNKTWTPNDDICNALEDAFHRSFQNDSIRKGLSLRTGKRFLLALDVSDSMSYYGCFGADFLKPSMAAAAMAMVTHKVEEHCTVMAFGENYQLENIDTIFKEEKLNNVMKKIQELNFGGTDCSLPMIYATKEKIDVDVFIIYTDCETCFGNITPAQALKEYRIKMNKPLAKLIVCAMQSNGFTIADVDDYLMMDICGFDSYAPSLITNFVKLTKEETCPCCGPSESDYVEPMVVCS